MTYQELKERYDQNVQMVPEQAESQQTYNKLLVAQRLIHEYSLSHPQEKKDCIALSDRVLNEFNALIVRSKTKRA